MFWFSFTSASLAVEKASQKKTLQEPESTISIADLRWQYRVLIISVDSKSTKDLIELWQSEYHLELQDGRLRVFSYKQLNNPGRYQPECGNCMLLVGLDGGIKSRTSISPDNLDAIFTIIDAMPMRRAELRAKSGK